MGERALELAWIPGGYRALPPGYRGYGAGGGVGEGALAQGTGHAMGAPRLAPGRIRAAGRDVAPGARGPRRCRGHARRRGRGCSPFAKGLGLAGSGSVRLGEGLVSRVAGIRGAPARDRGSKLIN